MLSTSLFNKTSHLSKRITLDLYFKAYFLTVRLMQRIACWRIKNFATLNETFSPLCKEHLLEHCKSYSNRLRTDRSGDHCRKAVTVFKAIKNKFEEYSIPWDNCVSLRVDNNNAMVGKWNFVAFQSFTFSQVVVIDIENLCFDLHYWFHKSSKRKDKLRGYFQFCAQEYQAILIQIFMRLLSLEHRSVTTSRKLTSLKVYVISENFSDKPFKILMTFLLILKFSFNLIKHYKETMKEINQNTHFKIFNWKVFQKKFKSYSRTHSSGKHELYYTARLDDDNIFILYKNIICGLTTKLNLTLVYSWILIFQKKISFASMEAL